MARTPVPARRRSSRQRYRRRRHCKRYAQGIKATIDKAGRLVIPKPLRDQLGLRPGEVDVHADGAGLRVEVPVLASLDEHEGRLVIPPSGAPIDDDLVRSLRDAGRR